MTNFLNKVKEKASKAKVAILASTMTALSTVTAFAEEGTSLIPAEVNTIIEGFAADIVPTVLGLIAILVPVGLTLWSIGFAVKKGLSFLKKNANKAV
jgi:fluoride ion exporter CrcB/FEX